MPLLQSCLGDVLVRMTHGDDPLPVESVGRSVGRVSGKSWGMRSDSDSRRQLTHACKRDAETGTIEPSKTGMDLSIRSSQVIVRQRFEIRVGAVMCDD